MSPDGKVTSVGGHSGGSIRNQPPGAIEKSDAIAIKLNHRDGMSVTMLYPYRVAPNEKVVFGEPFARKGAEDIFPVK